MGFIYLTWFVIFVCWTCVKVTFVTTVTVIILMHVLSYLPYNYHSSLIQSSVICRSSCCATNRNYSGISHDGRWNSCNKITTQWCVFFTTQNCHKTCFSVVSRFKSRNSLSLCEWKTKLPPDQTANMLRGLFYKHGAFSHQAGADCCFFEEEEKWLSIQLSGTADL